ncbi:hypothetical protein [Paenibacillus peoriae]|uniref:hypothetical protein n=1 Tax=Paenibacillus peoriae TaxID=59893 RepID=UPI0015E271E8|nr:hypothetical protein [Paenibacillus peoriae]
MKKDRVHPLELLEEEKAQRDIRLTVKMRMVNDNQNGSIRGLTKKRAEILLQEARKNYHMEGQALAVENEDML